jgi:ferric-dicitrate binding protein FerR (iron transport regulator)
MSDPTHDSLIAFLRGELPAADSTELSERLAKEPETADRLMELAREEVTLRSWAIARAASRELDEAVAGQRVQTETPPSRMFRHRRLWFIGAGAGVTATIAIVVALVLNRYPQDEAAASIATIEEVGGTVRIHRNDSTILVIAAGHTLLTGDRVETADQQSTATAVYADGTRLALAGETSVDFDHPPSDQKQLVVRNGNVAAFVTPQHPELPLMVTTATARLEVLGTNFLVDARSDATELSVAEGRVRLTRLADGASLEVQSGHHAVADSSREPLAANTATRAGDTFSEDFEHGLPPEWTRGELTRDDLPPDSQGGVRAQEDRQRDGVYYHIGTPKAWSQGLFAIHPDSHLHFTYRLSKPDWFQIFLSTRSQQGDRPSTATYRFKDERCWWPLTPGAWRTATVPLAAFGRVSDWSEQPPSPDELPFEILFTSKDNDLSLIIDRIWITRGGPGTFQVSGAE